MKRKMGVIFNISALVLLLIIAGLGLSGCGKADADAGGKAPYVRPVKVMKLQQSPGEETMIFPGKAKAVKEVDLAFRVAGPLTELNVDDGMAVKKGDIIAKIDSRDFSVNVKSLEAKLTASKAQYEEALLEYNRYENLVKVNATSKSNYDRVKAGYETAKAIVDGDVRALEAARNALADTILYAPFNGYIHKTLVENHETVNQGQPVIELVDLSGVEVEIGLPESLIARTNDFQSYACSFNAIPEVEFKAEFKEVGKKPNMSNNTYPLTLRLEQNNTNRVRPGMASDVKIVVRSKKKQLTFIIPASALLNKAGDETFVWILDQHHQSVEKRLVKPVQYSGGGVEVIGNIFTDELLIIAGAHHLTQGQAARMLETASETNVGQIL